jgi:hypothetical protein
MLQIMERTSTPFSFVIFTFRFAFESFKEFGNALDNTHVLAFAFIVPFVFNNFVSQLVYVRLIVQPHKCLAWALLTCPLGLPSWLVFIIISTTLKS